MTGDELVAFLASSIDAGRVIDVGIARCGDYEWCVVAIVDGMIVAASTPRDKRETNQLAREVCARLDRSLVPPKAVVH